MTSRCLYDIAAEQATLGGSLWSVETLAHVRELVDDAAVFYRPAHQGLWAVLVARADAGQDPGPTAVWSALGPGRIPGIDGVYLHTLLESCPVPGNAMPAAERVVRLARLRAWSELAAAILDRVNAPDADPDEIDAYAWARLEEAVRAHEKREDQRHAARAGYAYAALRDQVERVLRANPARTETALRQAAGRLASLASDGLLPAEAARDALTRAARTAGLDPTRAAAAIAGRGGVA